MKLLISLLICLEILFSSTVFEEIYADYKAEDYESSFKAFKLLAQEENDLDAAYILAFMYENGEGCKVDKDEADRWYRVASRGYYYRGKDDATRDIDKEHRKLYQSLEHSDDKETQETVKQYTQSLYNIKAHSTNYFLPISYRYNGSYAPTNGHEAKDIETEFQISIKYDFAASLFGLNEIYTAAYTQLAFWQLYEESAYFRETNYNPELFVTFPISTIDESLFIKALRVSFEHQSNGRGGAEERSWNYLSASTYMQYKYIFAELKLWYRLADSTDYNPELIDYMGHGHLQFMLPYKKHMAKLLLRSNFGGSSAVEFDYSYPAFDRQDLFFYLKTFNGYGESLIDYNHNVNKVGIGFSISR